MIPNRDYTDEDSSARALLDEERINYNKPTHLATVDEKKRLWWKNTVINSFFIAAW